MRITPYPVRMEETAKATIIDLANRFSDATGVSPSTIGKRALNDNTFFSRISGTDATFTLRTFDRLLAWFSENWPETAVWPEGVERPPTPEAA